MPVGFRLCNKKYHPLDPEGARRAGGRWNSKGVPAVYLADSISLAVLEVTVHALELPDDYYLTEVIFDEALVETLDITKLLWNWRDPVRADELRGIGDQWNSEKRSAILKIPSIVVPQEFNLVVNTEHADFPAVEHKNRGAFQFDHRLRPARVDLTHEG